jgi:hypothetical protein
MKHEKKIPPSALVPCPEPDCECGGRRPAVRLLDPEADCGDEEKKTLDLALQVATARWFPPSTADDDQIDQILETVMTWEPIHGA